MMLKKPCYKPVKLREISDIMADFNALEEQATIVLSDITGGVGR